MKLSAMRTNEVRLFQMVAAQHENRRATMFVNEDCVDSRSDVQYMTSERTTVYTASQKRRHHTLVHIFAKYRPIFTILSPMYSVGTVD